MSKLMTDSETLMWLLDPGVGHNDSNLYYKAKALKGRGGGLLDAPHRTSPLRDG